MKKAPKKAYTTAAYVANNCELSLSVTSARVCPYRKGEEYSEHRENALRHQLLVDGEALLDKLEVAIPRRLRSQFLGYKDGIQSKLK